MVSNADIQVQEKTISLPNAELFVRQFEGGERHLVFLHGGPGWDHSYLLPYVLPLAQLFRLTLLGFSFGGRVAMKFAERHPERVIALILASTTSSVDYHLDLETKRLYQERMTSSLKDQLSSLYRLAGTSHGDATRQLALTSLPLNIFDLSRLVTAQLLLHKVLFSDLWIRGYSAENMRSDSSRDYTASLRKTHVPILILHGEEDLVFPVSCATSLARELDSSRVLLKVIRNAGHLTHFEKTDDWIAAVQEFERTFL